ncbi:MAG: endoflagellar motor switch protein [Leptospira sp.]|nr:endoflagellar motor switch protein [Leptospira sp.]
MIESNASKISKAGVLFQLIGNYLPPEVFDLLSSEELEILLDRLNNPGKTNARQEKRILSEFNEILSGDRIRHATGSESGIRERILRELETLVPETRKTTEIENLRQKNKEDLSLIISGEPDYTIALVLCFSDPDQASLVVEEFPIAMRESIIEEIKNVDFHSEKVKDDLERFLIFKTNAIISDKNHIKVKDPGSKKAAELLNKISPNLSQDLVSKIRKKNPGFAEDIGEYLFSMHDLLKIGRNGLSKFVEKFHPIVLACAFRGVETSVREKIFSALEPWLLKSIILETDSMGPVSLAEIEEAQKGIIEKLQDCVNRGEIKLWKVK